MLVLFMIIIAAKPDLGNKRKKTFLQEIEDSVQLGKYFLFFMIINKTQVLHKGD